MATTTTTIVTTERVCDYCEKPESEVGFVQTYLMLPRRYYGKKDSAAADFPRGARDIDLCAACVLLLAPRSHVNVAAPRTKMCLARKGDVRCMLERGHKSEHLATTADHWGWLVSVA